MNSSEPDDAPTADAEGDADGGHAAFSAHGAGDAAPAPPMRRLGWFTPQPDGNLGITVQAHVLTEKEWAEFEKYAGVVNDMRAFMIDYLALVADYEAFVAVDDEIAADASLAINARFLDTPALVRAQAKAQRSVSNFLSAGSAFRDRAQKRLSGRGARAIPSPAALKARISEIYDASIDYRVTYILRNHAQHHENPISMCPIEGARADDGKIAARMRMGLDPQVLAADKKLPAAKRAELLTLDAQLPMAGIIERTMADFSRIMLFVLEANRQRLIEMAQYAAALFRAFEIPHNAKPVIFNGFDPTKGPPTTENCYLFGLDELTVCVEMLDRLGREVG